MERHPRTVQDEVRPRFRLGPLALLFVLVVAALAVRWFGDAAADEAFELAGATMGTSYSVVVDADVSAANRERVRAALDQRFHELNRMMSTYDTASELSRFNRWASTQPLEASAELIDVLERAREVSERSGGALDVTVSPLVEAWGFGPASRIDDPLGPTPSEAELERLRQRVGFDQIVADPAAGTISKAHPETTVDLSAIAKGYAADVVSILLRELGYDHTLVEVGGELAASGTRRSGEPWRVGIESPDDQAPGVWGTLTLVDEGIATSGDYRDYYERGGVRYAHIIDPRTGRPITSRGASVTVVHESAAMADAWATALTVLGPEDGYELAVREGLAALFLRTAEGGIRPRATPALEGRVATVPSG